MKSGSVQPRVMIVDDEPVVRSLLRATLGGLDCQVVGEVEDGQSAVRTYAELKPDIVFLDIDMPGISGLDILVDLVQADANAFVAMVSGHNSIENVQLAISRGAQGFIVKPISPKKLQMLIDKYRAKTQSPR